MTVIKSSHYLEYDLTRSLAFKNRKGHGLQGSTKLSLLAISSCLLKKERKRKLASPSTMNVYVSLADFLMVPGLIYET